MERPEDDVYMLYTGGTTGMPKGVMYAMGGITSAFVLQGYPLVGLEPPTDVSQVGRWCAPPTRAAAAWCRSRPAR